MIFVKLWLELLSFLAMQSRNTIHLFFIIMFLLTLRIYIGVKHE